MNVLKSSILIVDDEPDIRDWLEAVLQDDSVNLLHAESLAEAVDLYLLHRPEKIILDLILPDARGCEAVEGLKRLGAENILVLTGFPGQKSDALRLGASKYIEKPCSTQLLLSTLQQL